MNELDERLRQLAESVQQLPDPRVEQRLLTEFRKRYHRRPLWVYFAEAAAVLIVSLRRISASRDIEKVQRAGTG